MIKEPWQMREETALRQLRTALEKLGFKTKSSASDKNEFFYVFVNRDDKGNPRDGLFIVISLHTDFSWSRDGKHPMSDIPGAARRIQQVIQEQIKTRALTQESGKES